MKNPLTIVFVAAIVLACLQSSSVLADETENTFSGITDEDVDAAPGGATEHTLDIKTGEGTQGGSKNKNRQKEKITDDKNKGKDMAQPSPDSQQAALIESFNIYVHDVENEPVKRATVKISWDENGTSFKKITNSEGIASFKNLPLTEVTIKVTADGHRSHVQTIALEIDDKKVVIEMTKRD